MNRRADTAVWTLALAAAALWPGRALSMLDGAPLNGRAEAVVIGVVLPLLWALDTAYLRRAAVRAAIVGLLALKIGSALTFAQEGLCARFSTAAPFAGVISTIAIDEPDGVLRSWDARADWRASTPRCTAMLDRAYESRASFPAAFVNLTAALQRDANVDLDVSGYLTADAPGRLTFDVGSGAALDAGTFEAGTHPLRLHTAMTDRNEWRFVPRWNGEPAWRNVRFSASAPSSIDRLVPFVGGLTTLLVLGIVAGWVIDVVARAGLPFRALAWTVGASSLVVAIGTAAGLDRLASLVLVGASMVPVALRHRNARTALLLVGVPWLALFAGRAWSDAGRFTLYSQGDDWQMYQAAAYSIFLNGDWIRGGSPTFLFQPLYRWIAGALHLVFGDSSVGELYWDAACLLAAAMVAFFIVKRVAGFAWAVAAAALTLATFTISPIWYLVGRGLSEISGLGWMSLAALFVMRAKHGRVSAAILAGAFAVLMFYTRLNHLLMTAFLTVFLLPSRVPARWPEVWRAIRRVRRAPLVAYGCVIVAGILLFALHTWWYTGHFSVTYGTSFGAQQTGLRPWTILSPAVWSRIGEALGAQLSMREPPALDSRSLLVLGGAVASGLALLQVPFFSALPASLVVMTAGTIAGSFVAHTHDYPGRMTVHVVPFAVATSTCVLATVLGARSTHGARGELERRLPGTERSFGFSVGGVLLGIAALLVWRHHPLRAAVVSAIGGLLVASGAVAPSVLRWPRIWWWRVALMVGGFNAKVILTVMFGVLFVPVGLLWRLAGKDPLARRRGESGWTPYPARYNDPQHFRRMF